MLLTHRVRGASTALAGLAVLLLAGPAAAGVKKISLVPTRTSGTAPLPVFFDATGTQLSSGGLDHGAFFWDFDDPASRHPGAVGFTAAHVFEKPGVYHVTLRVRDATGPEVRRTVKITVSAFAGTTYYVASHGKDANDGRSPRRPFRTFDHAMARLKGDLASRPAAVRVLFRRGDRFSTRTGVAFGHDRNGKPAIIGAWGTGPKPVIENRGGEDDITFGFGDCSGFRWVDLEFTGTYDFQRDTGPSTTHVYFTDRARDFLMLRVSCRRSGQLFIVGTTNPLDKEELFVVDCEANDFEGVGVYIAGKHIAVLGTRLVRSSFTHLLRVWYADRGVFSENVLLDPSYNHPSRGRHALKFHADTGGRAGRSRYAVVSDNAFKGCTWSVVIGPQDTVSREHLEHIIVERNHFLADQRTRRALMIIADDVTVRNNLFSVDDASAIDTVECIVLPRYPLVPGSRRVKIYNNTALDLRDDRQTTRFIEIETDQVPGLEIKNNIFYAPHKRGDTSAAIRFVNTAALRNLTADHNLWYLPRASRLFVVRNAATRQAYALGDWQRLGQGKHSKDEDPKLASPKRGQVFLEAGSPAIDAGAELPGVFESMNGERRPQGAATDMGAFEAPAPSGSRQASLRATPRSQAPGRAVDFQLDAPGAAGFTYQVALSLGTFPAVRPGGGLTIPLRDDALLRFSVDAAGHPLFRNFLSRLDRSGRARAGVTIPRLPALRGAGFFACALIWNPTAAFVTNPVSVAID